MTISHRRDGRFSWSECFERSDDDTDESGDELCMIASIEPVEEFGKGEESDDRSEDKDSDISSWEMRKVMPCCC